MSVGPSIDGHSGCPDPDLSTARYRIRKQAAEIDALRTQLLTLARELKTCREGAGGAELVALRNTVGHLEAEAEHLREELAHVQPQLEELRRFKASRAYRAVVFYYGLFDRPAIGPLLRGARRMTRALLARVR